MKLKKLTPEQVITLNDYPIRNAGIMGDYFRKYREGVEDTRIPVVHKGIVIPYLEGDLLRAFRDFLRGNPNSEYFMLDGSHRTTASTLSGNLIEAVILESDADIIEAKKMVDEGILLDNNIYNEDIRGNCVILRKHFSKRPKFYTVRQKTDRLVKGGIIAQSLIDFYSNL